MSHLTHCAQFFPRGGGPHISSHVPHFLVGPDGVGPEGVGPEGVGPDGELGHFRGGSTLFATSPVLLPPLPPAIEHNGPLAVIILCEEYNSLLQSAFGENTIQFV